MKQRSNDALPISSLDLCFIRRWRSASAYVSVCYLLVTEAESPATSFRYIRFAFGMFGGLPTMLAGGTSGASEVSEI